MILLLLLLKIEVIIDIMLLYSNDKDNIINNYII